MDHAKEAADAIAAAQANPDMADASAHALIGIGHALLALHWLIAVAKDGD